MSTARRRRWIDVLRRTAGVGVSVSSNEGTALAQNVLEDAALLNAEEQLGRSLAESGTRAERLAAAVARQRALIGSAAERAELIASRSEALTAGAARVGEVFERLGVVALNAGLEGARTAEPQGRALLLVSEEIRANVRRGADSAEQLARMIEEIAVESAEVRRQIERSRTEVGEVAQEAAQLQAATQQASKSLEDLAARLRKATGIDPEATRAAARAAEHARGLMAALAALASAQGGAPILGALRPVIGPLARLLGEIEAGSPEGGRGGAEGGS